MRTFLLFAIVSGALLFTVPRQTTAEDVWLLAAASLSDAVTAITESYQAKSNDKIINLFASSSALARQIENGAPADIFISASLDWMDMLIENDLIEPTSRQDALGNSLVLVTPVDSAIDLEIKTNFPLAKALGDSRLAIADPDSVPAGLYSAAALKSLGVWPMVADKLAPGSDVRNTLALVERGETRLGIVYETDVTASKKVRIVDHFPNESHPPIIYSFGIVSDQDRSAVVSFYDFLTGAEAMNIFKIHGFTPQ